MQLARSYACKQHKLHTNLADIRSIDARATQKIVDYMKQNNISVQGIMKYAKFVPARAIKNFMSSEVQNAFA